MESKIILLVEDNADDELLTIKALEKAKIKNKIVVARDGAEALEYLSVSEPLPNVVLLDLKLPKVDGHEVLKQIRASKRTALLPVVILTSSREERDLHMGYASGANSYIVKPVDLIQFTNAVQHLSLYWLLLNENSSQ